MNILKGACRGSRGEESPRKRLAITLKNQVGNGGGKGISGGSGIKKKQRKGGRYIRKGGPRRGGSVVKVM